ncbi:hypothetical protein PVK06_040640 [Gossypium arboreum]|uniref:RNase H type-1 domain-containing protein n=1 Tax=Gossypium arboreum TaxID=29729 RepID=A0ABR0N5Z8_GOSAR|nr:hypothetical protein PVK06_040640 [Gossypium arboreum]
MIVFSSSHSSVLDVIDTCISWTRSYSPPSTPSFLMGPMVTIMKWSALESGWVKLNTDDNEKVFRIEARSMLEGLCLLWDKEYHEVELECDNALLVEIILAREALDCHFIELKAIHKLIRRNWRIRIRHIPRAHNAVADFIPSMLL